MANPASDTLLSRLNEVIDNREYFVGLKQDKIDKIKKEFLFKERRDEIDIQYNYFLALSKEYQTFKFDSAFHYSSQLIDVAYKSKDPNKIIKAQIEFANILITAGIFNEAMDTLKSINLSVASKQNRAEYFSMMSRGYFDMESFSQSKYYSRLYRRNGVSYFDSALTCYPPETWEYRSLVAQKYIKAENCQMAIEILRDIISSYQLSNDELAIQYMLLSFSYNIQNEPDLALKYMVESSVADFMGAKKEAVALVFVANALFERAEVMLASKYINVALEESSFYGSNFRLWQISQYSPIIKSEHIVTIENQKRQVLKYLVIVSVLSFLLIASFTVIYRQISKLKRVKNMLEATNGQLAMINEELVLANRIKEEYVGYYFSVSSQMIEKLEKFKNSIYRKFSRRQFDELALELDSINIHKEKSFLYTKFDEVFLQIFPNFIDKFNDLLKENEQLHPREGHLLNTELRIYALIRLGITDNEKIAKILDNSVNTIYAYKTKVRNMAKLPKEEFEQEVKKIKRF
ncbi:MAG: DUF6377 domain-containing protein [Bacteroidales bacterium]|nr:DUF6377 domain-containing protein [Bacteroidales bacterium]